jgi:metal-responsive CopG/Arc/MetJ family transcriptional regulator
MDSRRNLGITLSEGVLERVDRARGGPGGIPRSRAIELILKKQLGMEAPGEISIQI